MAATGDGQRKQGHLPSPDAPRRYEHVASLDGLRFLAAAVVLVGHSHNCFVTPPELGTAIRQSPAAILINGYGAVHLFFVLSGFCLAGSAQRARGPVGLGQFFLRRWFRIHPPYVFALLTAWLASFLYSTARARGGLTPYLLERAAVHLSPSELASYLLYPSAAGMQLGPAWTLEVEMSFSILLPLLVFVARSTHWSVLLIFSLYPLAEPGAVPAFLRFGIYFALGIAVYQERERLGRWLPRLPTWAQAAFLLLGLFVFAAPLAFALVYATSGLLVSAAGGSLLLLAAIYFPGVGGFLARPRLAYLGRISYSFYLLHYPVMILATRMISGPAGWPLRMLFLVAVFAGTTAAAALAYRWIERPSIRAGNALCSLFARRTGRIPQLSRLAS